VGSIPTASTKKIKKSIDKLTVIWYTKYVVEGSDGKPQQKERKR
jgi:hypothetical protein